MALVLRAHEQCCNLRLSLQLTSFNKRRITDNIFESHISVMADPQGDAGFPWTTFSPQLTVTAIFVKSI